MKKIKFSLLLALVSISTILHGQVGINTTNPQGIFHIDGAKDNATTGIPTAAQQANDIAVTSQGRLGLGTTNPSAKLDVQGDLLLNAAVIGTTKNVLDINIGQDGFTYGNRTDNFGINIKSLSSGFTGPVSRINFGDVSTGTAVGTRYLSFSVGRTPNELMYLTDGNNGRVGIGNTAPTNKLHITAAADPLRLEGTTAGDPNTDRPVVIDANGVIKSINTLSVLGIPSPAIFRLETSQNNFLNGISAGFSQVVSMALVKNLIPGLSYNASTSTITFPAGTYEMMFVYEGTHNNTGCTISSYFVDFPLNNSTQRIHSTAAHIEGVLSNHGGSLSYATTIPAGQTWRITLGRGVSGNCNGTGMTLRDNSTQLLVFRVGD